MKAKQSSVTFCGACHEVLSSCMRFCPWCGYRAAPIDEEQVLATAKNMLDTEVKSAMLLTRIRGVEGKAAVGWIKTFRDADPTTDPEDSPRIIDLTKRRYPDEQVFPLTRRVTPAPIHDPTPIEEEDRLCRRFPVKVTVGYATEHNFYTGFLQNLSSGCLFVATHSPADIGEVLEVTFTVPGLPRSTTAVCQVQWGREYNNLLPEMVPGMGLRFIKLNAEARAAVELFIRNREPIFFSE